MVKSNAQVVKSIKAFARQVAHDYHIDQVILFGSYAKGNARDESDIDVAVISSDFRNKPEMKILMYLSRIATKVDCSLEAVAFYPEELIDPDPRSFSYQVKRFGRAIPF